MDDGKKVWVPHAGDAFKLGRIVDIGADTITVEPFDTPGKVKNLLINDFLIVMIFDKIFDLTCKKQALQPFIF